MESSNAPGGGHQALQASDFSSMAKPGKAGKSDKPKKMSESEIR